MDARVLLFLLLSISASSAHLKFISDCSPYKDTSCSIRCQLYQCADYTCGSETTENPPCKQNLRVQSFNFIELTDGQIAMSLKYDISPEELSNLTMIFHRVGSLHETHFVAVFSRMNTSDYPVFLKEVISEFPIPEIQREDEVVVKYSTNVCGSPKTEVLKVPKYLVANQSLVAEYHECPGVKASFPTVLGPVSSPGSVSSNTTARKSSSSYLEEISFILIASMNFISNYWLYIGIWALCLGVIVVFVRIASRLDQSLEEHEKSDEQKTTCVDVELGNGVEIAHEALA